ncbi:MAG: Mut7-C RNAse domain-containing protein [Candidatus Omnitrophota bacterium]
MKPDRFIVTSELGKLAKWLRILGYDTVYYDRKDPGGMIILALREQRVILTRSSIYANFKGIKQVIVARDLVEDQLDQVAAETGLSVNEDALFHICVECNTPLIGIRKKDVEDKVPEEVYGARKEFKACPMCQKIYWKGTHWDMVKTWLEKRRGAEGKKAGKNGTDK